MNNKKVMIIDDDREFLEELGELLGRSGYDFVPVEDSRSVLKTAAQSKPDVILLDLKMPYKSGFQLVDELRHFTDLQCVPVIAMTGFFKEGYEPLLHICGIKRCLRKPFNPLDVIAQIEEVLSEL